MPKQNYDPAVRPPSQIRRNKQQRAQSEDWIIAFLESARVCTVATSWDDLPFCNATLFWYDAAHHQIIFHSNIIGRVRANIERNPNVTLSCEEMGDLLPSNAALEFSVQYRSVVAFGEARLISDPTEAREMLYALISKYFPKMHAGEEYRPITDTELAQTSVYAVKISEWSGKANVKSMADQIEDWPPLSEAILKGGFA